jgi:hypothetical protein
MFRTFESSLWSQRQAVVMRLAVKRSGEALH